MKTDSNPGFILVSMFIVFILTLLSVPGTASTQPGNSNVRIAIVYNTSITGFRYRDGIRSVLDDRIGDQSIQIIEKPYLKSSHGQDSIKKLIRNKEVDIILGPTESDVFTGVYNTDGITDNKISIISGLVTTNVGNDPQGFFFRLNVEVTDRIYNIWSLLNKYWISKSVIIYEDSEFGRNSEMAFKTLCRDLDLKYEPKSILFSSPEIPISDIKKFIIDERPELIGLFCEREDVERLYNSIQLLNNTGIPYKPYFFGIIDVTSVGEQLEQFYFPSLQDYDDSVSVDSIKEDEVFILGQETALLVKNALEANSNGIDFSTAAGRIQFRNHLAGILQGESSAKTDMRYLKMKNLGPLNLYKMNNNMLIGIESYKQNNVFSILSKKFNRLYSTHNYKLIINILIVMLITFSISHIELRLHFPQKHIKINKTGVFYMFLFGHFFTVLLIYIFLAETGRINYSDTLMVIIISLTPSAFFKTTFFESKSGTTIGLEGAYKRMMSIIENQIMNVRYRRLKGLKNLIAYYNSQQNMRNALLRVYKNHPSSTQSSKLIQKMEEKLLRTKDYLERRRVAAELIIRQFDREQLKAEGFVPSSWDYSKNINPQVILRRMVKYCSEDDNRRKSVIKLLHAELRNLQKRSPERYNEVTSFYNKEKSLTMSNEGELLVDLRLLMVIRNFNLRWFKDKGIINPKEYEEIIRKDENDSIQ